jgi:hypothetical protein
MCSAVLVTQPFGQKPFVPYPSREGRGRGRLLLSRSLQISTNASPLCLSRTRTRNKEPTENGERRTENGERRTENGERRTENGERRTENAYPSRNHVSSVHPSQFAAKYSARSKYSSNQNLRNHPSICYNLIGQSSIKRRPQRAPSVLALIFGSSVAFTIFLNPPVARTGPPLLHGRLSWLRRTGNRERRTVLLTSDVFFRV